MGNAESTLEAEEVLQGIQADGAAAAEAPQAPGVRVYHFVPAGNSGKWEKLSSSARPQFYDYNEDNEAPPLWHLEVEAADIDAPVNLDLNYLADAGEKSIRFTANSKCYALKFPTEESYDAFWSAINTKQFENTFGVQDTQKNREKVLGKDYAQTMFAVGMDSSEEMEVEDVEDKDVPLPDELKERKTDMQGDPISGIIMGAMENSYVMRGSTFDVMRNIEGGLQEKNQDMTINLTPVKGGAGITPSKVVMANQERFMNMITPNKPTSLFQTDVEYQKVVSEWSFAKDTVEVPIKDITSDYKAAQLEDTSTFLGLDNNRLCRWDLRTSAGVVNDNPVASYEGGKDYSRGTNFNCMATSGDGFVVVGSDDGKVRLYSNRSLTRAVTSLPGLGAPVTAVDVTYNGEWVLATTNTYLMLIRTIWKDKGGIEMNGFKKSIGKNSPRPTLLKLRPQDHLKTGYKPLQKAKFTWVTEQGKHERLIVASCGTYSVLWDFGKVRQAANSGVVGLAGLPACSEYKLVQKEEDVVESSFMHDRYRVKDTDSMVVLTKHSVFSLSGE